MNNNGEVLLTYAKPILDRKPFIDINHNDIVGVLLPIWKTKTETTRRLQQRLFRIISFAKKKNGMKEKITVINTQVRILNMVYVCYVLD